MSLLEDLGVLAQCSESQSEFVVLLELNVFHNLSVVSKVQTLGCS
jgi:hypothetical protein